VAKTSLGGTRGGLPVVWRVPLLVLGMISLLTGVLAGLLRAGSSLPPSLPLPRPELMAVHGPLMVAAFFGTVIGLERAVALGRRWGYLSPLAAGIGGLLLILGAAPVPALLLMAGGAAVLTLATLRAAERQPSLHAHILALASALAVLASLAWLFGRPSLAVAGWIGFLVLTIAGERLELSRFLPPSLRARQVFVGIVCLLLFAVLLAWFSVAGMRVLGLALALLAIWLLRQDVARRTVRQQGLTRFIAVCLLSGYLWLFVGGVLLALQPPLALLADAALHAIFVGFVLAMVFGHAPIIFPAIVRVGLPYHVVFYLPLIVLHASLLLRVGGGLAGELEWRAWGAVGNALCLVLFIVTMASAAVRSACGKAAEKTAEKAAEAAKR
ncbi:MAG: hypothetical protein QG619_22, partial [Pseudomonadota bacterium]|nr:hypothetical protein [Pseudomonadota bacterium]